jgi:DNA polymerase III alpha subunit (gram-positive type)
MKIIIFDTEYLSLSKRCSNLRNLIKFKKKLFPEIIQISFLKCSNIYLKNKQKKLNIFIKIKQKIPKQITKLTNITSNILQKKGHCFKESMNLIDKFIDKKSILLANGEDIEILKLNIRFNNFKRGTKKLVNYVNYRKILNRINKKKNYDTENLNKIFKFKINFHLHNASNDCIVIYKSLRKLIKIYGKKEFEDMIAQNKELIKF